jgi:shikimate dehydrogenase
LPYLHDLQPDAAEIGAVNCISAEAGRLKGHNTDWTGFRDSLLPLLRPHDTSALVLGSGGASLAVRYALRKIGIPFHTVSRTPGKADFTYGNITPALLKAHFIIINTTTLGTGGRGKPALPYDALEPEHLLYDLVYNPEVTPFLEEGARRGAVTRNGLEMLERLAEASWKVWQRANP